MQKYTFHINGLHCSSCKTLVENIINEQKGVAKVSVNLTKQTLVVEGEFSTNVDEKKLIADWSKVLTPHNFSLSLEKQIIAKNFGLLVYAIPLGIIILGLFFLLQKSGIVNFGFEGNLTPTTALLIGIIASLSTCLAMVGGLILSLSAKISQEVSTTRPFLLFHIGRVAGFALMGGILGAVGQAIAINHTVIAILGVTASLIMIILGINLLDIFHNTKRFQFALPRHFFDRFLKTKNGFFAPIIIGAATFFLPCGFTQSMQFAALSCGSFWLGATIMTAFAIGTLPMLSLISFSSFRFSHTKNAPLFFKTAGIIVIGLGAFSLLAGFASLGIIKPLFNI